MGMIRMRHPMLAAAITEQRIDTNAHTGQILDGRPSQAPPDSVIGWFRQQLARPPGQAALQACCNSLADNGHPVHIGNLVDDISEMRHDRNLRAHPHGDLFHAQIEELEGLIQAWSGQMPHDLRRFHSYFRSRAAFAEIPALREQP